MRKPLFCIALLLLACANALGQGEAAAAPAPQSHGRLDELKGEAARLLESQGNRERAWGAHLAGRNGLADLTPALVRTLSDPALGYGPEEKLVRQAALDALIRLHAKVPAEVLSPLTGNFSAEAVILLSMWPEENAAALLEMFAARGGEAGPDAHWHVVGNLLAETKARGFAAVLLRDLKVEADIAVLDREGEIGFGYSGGGGCGCCFSYEPPEGFPPVSFYSLTYVAGRDAVVVAPGKRPVFYQRSTTPYGGPGFAMPLVRDIARVEFLAALLDATEDGLDFNARPSESVVCKDARECRRELAGLRGRIEQSYAALVGRLVEKSLLDGVGDAPAAPPMTFTLYDHRRSRSFPLPDRLKGVTVVVEEMEPEPEEEAGAESP